MKKIAHKCGPDLFELDCHANEKIKMIEVDYGLKGFAIVIKLFQKIYGGYGYYREWNDELALLFTLDNGLQRKNQNLVNEIVLDCFKRNIFSKEMYRKFGILTSKEIQERYLKAISKSKVNKIKHEYLLINMNKKMVNAKGE